MPDLPVSPVTVPERGDGGGLAPTLRRPHDIASDHPSFSMDADNELKTVSLKNFLEPVFPHE